MAERDSNASVQQTSFLGGEFSPDSQGRFDLPQYRTGLNSSLNGQAVEEGAWKRRSGRRRLGDTYFGAPGVLRTFWSQDHQPVVFEITYEANFTQQSWLRFWTQQFPGKSADDMALLCDNFSKIRNLSNTTPVVMEIDAIPPECMNTQPTWQDGDDIQIYMDPSNPLANGPGYVNRTFTIAAVHDGTPLWATGTDVHPGTGGLITALASNASLYPGQSVYSPSGEFQLIFQDDGNVVLYQDPNGPGRTALWATGTEGQAANNLTMQTDGNLILALQSGHVIFATGTNGHTGASLVIQNDGNLVIYGEGSPNKRKWYLYDAVTGDAIDGNQDGFLVKEYGNSYAGHIARFALPYTSLDEVRRVRHVQTGRNCYLLSKITRSQLLTQVYPAPENAPSSSAIWFHLGDAIFQDGPYLDPLPGGSQTGNSVGKISRISNGLATFTVTDSSYFFQASDINRAIRVWCQPQPYQTGASYTGLDGNPFPRVTWQGNFYAIFHNTSSAPNSPGDWYLESDFGRWGYGYIREINVDGNPYACTIELQNPTGPGGGLDDATVVANGTTPDGAAGEAAIIDTWQLGVYTQNQYPACGTFHEGRLFLGGAVPNRVDACMSDGGSVSGFLTLPNNQSPSYFPTAQTDSTTNTSIQSLFGGATWGQSQSQAGNLPSIPIPGATLDDYTIYFSPTNSSGQVLDNHGIALVMNAAEQDQITWLHPHQDGLIIGCVSGEYVLTAASEGVLTPSSALVRKVTRYGAAFVEPVKVGAALVYVQALGKRVMEYVTDFFSRRFVGHHLNEYAKHLTTDGIIETAYQEETAPTFWASTGNGNLISCTYRRLSIVEPAPTFSGWSRYSFGDSRKVMSLTMAANSAGTLDQLMMLTSDAALPPLNPIQPAPAIPVPPPPPAPPSNPASGCMNTTNPCVAIGCGTPVCAASGGGGCSGGCGAGDGCSGSGCGAGAAGCGGSDGAGGCGC